MVRMEAVERTAQASSVENDRGEAVALILSNGEAERVLVGGWVLDVDMASS